MNLAITLARVLFGILSLFFMTLYTVTLSEGLLAVKILSGICLSAAVIALFYGIETVFRKYSLRYFNVIILGLFLGYLMGKGLVLLFDTCVQITTLSMVITHDALDIMRICLFLTGSYLGTLLCIRFSDEISVSLPFVRFSQSLHKTKNILLDESILLDPRILDFCASGIVNNLLVMPKFVVKELSMKAECGDEFTKPRAKKALEVLKKLEEMSKLALRYNETDFSDVSDPALRLFRLAKQSNANILTSDVSRMQAAASDEISFISLNIIANALKPLTPPGETITIKVQRFGKEPKQGVGYLDDGTMVVINNGGDYIGEVIETQVISVKQTSAGRIIFTNAIVETNYNSVMYDQHPVYEHQHD